MRTYRASTDTEEECESGKSGKEENLPPGVSAEKERHGSAMSSQDAERDDGKMRLVANEASDKEHKTRRHTIASGGKKGRCERGRRTRGRRLRLTARPMRKVAQQAERRSPVGSIAGSRIYDIGNDWGRKKGIDSLRNNTVESTRAGDGDRAHHIVRIMGLQRRVAREGSY